MEFFVGFSRVVRSQEVERAIVDILSISENDNGEVGDVDCDDGQWLSNNNS